MLYLAEVKKQTRGFISGIRTDLKLLACQHNDQTWSVVPGDETVSTEELDTMGEGTLVILNLGNNRQVQGQPKVAAPELIRQLQRLSRLSEKLKDQQEEIEQWKESLTYQSQELSRREMEMEAQIEQLEKIRQESQQIAVRRQEADSAWKKVQESQRTIKDFQRRFGNLINLPPQYTEKLQQLIHRLTQTQEGSDVNFSPLQIIVSTIEKQQDILNGFWQQLEPLNGQIRQYQENIEQQKPIIENYAQEIDSTRSALEQAKIQFEVQQNILTNKQARLRNVNLNLRNAQDLQESLTNIANGISDVPLDSKVDVVALENMPLGELEEIVSQLQADLDKLVRFVNDQEEELTLQCQTVEELIQKLTQASAYDRITIEEELAEEQERKQFLDETLVGQRRNIKEQQNIFLQHLRVLRRRQGVIDFESNLASINLDPLLLQIEELQNNAREESQLLESEIEHLQRSLEQIQEMIEQLDKEQERKNQELKTAQDNWHQAQLEVTRLTTRLTFYQEALQPIQDRLDELRKQLEGLKQWLLFD